MERIYNIPLRREFLKVPRYKRAKKAVSAVRSFLLRHMKATRVVIGSYLNSKLWERGIKNPPHHVKVNAVRDDKGVVIAELVGAPKKVAEKPEQKKEKKAAKPAVHEELKQDVEELKEALSGELGKAETEVKDSDVQVQGTEEKPPEDTPPKRLREPKAEKAESA
ncbi:60S ribosomal protein L31 [Candidatus Woesearchaeota archaeon]|nr:60S ribosomal protein L31 [Candidatus Woesearchaeota archaeon]